MFGNWNCLEHENALLGSDQPFGNLFQRPAVTGRGGLLQNRTEPFQKPVSIRIVFKNVSSLDTPAYDMMQGTRRIYSGLTWHVTSLPQTNEKKRLNSTPLH